MEIKTFAKINLSLNIVGKKDDGYHKLNMIMQTVSLYDRVYLTRINEGIELSTNIEDLPVDFRNIAYQAAEIMLKTFDIDSGVNIYIEKNIPIGAGLAGGSTNAAGVVKLMNKMFKLRLSESKLDKIALKLGADVPFSMREGTYLAKGIGEILSPIKPGFKNQKILLVKPDFSVSTKDAFKKVNGNFNTNLKTDFLVEAIKERDLISMNKYMENDLEKIIIKDFKEIKKIKEKLTILGASATLMSGSGPTVYGIFENENLALKAKNEFLKIYKETFLVYTL